MRRHASPRRPIAPRIVVDRRYLPCIHGPLALARYGAHAPPPTAYGIRGHPITGRMTTGATTTGRQPLGRAQPDTQVAAILPFVNQYRIYLGRYSGYDRDARHDFSLIPPYPFTNALTALQGDPPVFRSA